MKEINLCLAFIFFLITLIGAVISIKRGDDLSLIIYFISSIVSAIGMAILY
ncbi:hypothetical protein [Bacillus pseudomycoides]|uniref:hypothetical protein n=1 Tax=Bacillus pseudomycoides TaxID=64104 RepID=UPI000500055F|nr:hypothetical protein [Bacillus pseudomycoides]KFN12799.1 putative membrane protein [Bacillus pseudomycoides]MED0855702.1 hypothetical protein [Bacillus pseudomycoides]